MTGHLEDVVIPEAINDVILPQGRYPESFGLISILEVCREWGGARRGYLEDFQGS